MKKEQTKNEAGRYEAPKVKVKELRSRRVLCASDFSFGDAGTEGANEESGS